MNVLGKNGGTVRMSLIGAAVTLALMAGAGCGEKQTATSSSAAPTDAAASTPAAANPAAAPAPATNAAAPAAATSAGVSGMAQHYQGGANAKP